MSAQAWQMGSYGAYVWSSYGLTVLGLVCMLIAASRSWQSELKSARRRAQIAQSAEQQS